MEENKNPAIEQANQEKTNLVSIITQEIKNEALALTDMLALQRKTNVTQALVTKQVCEETAPSGKAMFSNAESREAEVSLRLFEDDNYNNTILALNKKRAELKELERLIELHMKELSFLTALVPKLQ